MKKSYVIHPFLFAIFPILFLFSHNVGKTSFSETLMPTAIVLGFTLLLLILSGLILRDNKKAGIVVSIFIILLFSYGHVRLVLRGWWQVGIFIKLFRDRYLLAIWGILFTCCAYFVIRTRRNLRNFTNFLNVVAASLVVISLTNIAAYRLKTKSSWQNIENVKNIETHTDDLRKANTFPDIYYIILDRYASTSTLKEMYNFDNREFINYLSDKGFYVASESVSNYPNTAHSLASSLNMMLINHLSDKVGKESDDWRPIYTLLQDYKVWRFLKSKGYKFIHFGSWWYPTSKNKYADMNVSAYASHEFSIVLYRTTMFYPFGLGIYDKDREQWKRVLYKFDRLAEMPNIQEPAFVFAHMLVPHDPYVFDRNGKFLSSEEQDKRTTKENYVEQLIFTNKKVKMLIHSLLSKSAVPPIIILQADEGPFPPGTAFDKNFNWKQATKEQFRQKMRILNAYYLPNVDKNVLYPSITPLNSFRLIFNLYFSTNFELLPDENYAYPFVNWRQLYNFFNVTDKFRQN